MLQHTRLGRAIRAVAENSRAAARMGIAVEAVVVKTFFLASALGAISGIFMGLSFNSVHVLMGSTVELKGFAVIILAGMGSLPGAVVASFILAISEVWAVAYVSSHFRDMIAFGMLIVVLLLRPQGLFGRLEN
jgi:branched-chain amino acid transport system permease protein